jgi:hypothetical protein
MKALLRSLALSLPMLLGPVAARADIPPAEVEDCRGKKANDSCTNSVLAKPGTCKNDTCTSAKPDGTSSSYECVKCVAGSSSDDGGCTVGKPGAARKIGPWFLAGLFSLLFVVKRRRAD